MEDLKQMMREYYLLYASYVILDRAIPHVVDGLKPVQRRILQTLFKIHDGKLHKVANVAGQTMALHPHGEAPIYEALVNMANKGFLFDLQGNFGNIYTGDPAAAARYIETRLSKLSLETLFNPELTQYIPSYDGRNQEPVTLPAKIPLVLMQGAEGIAVGMSTRILPHNFKELLLGAIDVLEGKQTRLLPDFPTGGVMDATEYEGGRGKVKLRAKIVIKDDKTLVVEEICYGTTTESLTRSIDEAAKKGKLKIESINDYTADKVEIEIKLPRGQHAQNVIDALYAYTDCQVSLNSQVLVIKDNLPWETTVDEVLAYHTELVKGYLKRELELEQEKLLEKIFQRTLERLFIENRLYKNIEEIKEYEVIHRTMAADLEPFHDELERIPTQEDRERLLNLPIRRITRFDLNKNVEEIRQFQKRLKEVEKHLRNVKAYTIGYLQDLIQRYGELFPRKTRIQSIGEVDVRAMERRSLQVYYDSKQGFIGTQISGDHSFECTNYDKLLVVYKSGEFQVINIPDKEYLHHQGKKVAFVGIADKKSVLHVAYSHPDTKICYAKRFVINKFIVDRSYRYLEEGMKLEYISTQPETLEVEFEPKPKQKVHSMQFQMGEVPLKGTSAKGIRISPKEVKKLRRVRGS